MYYLCSDDIGPDQLRNYHAADLHICLEPHFQKTGFHCTALLLIQEKNENYPLLSVNNTNTYLSENKDADQLRGDREADQRLCFCYMDSTIPLLPTSKIPSL